VTVLLLILLGVASALGRALSIAGILTEELTLLQIEGMHLLRPATVARNDAEVRSMESRLASQPALTAVHIGAGALFLVFGAVQFSSRIRGRHLAFHRWSGRVLVATSLAGTTASFYFGVLHPYGGISEVTSIALFGVLFMAFLLRAVYAIRRGDVGQHREWMIRAFSLGVGIAVIRVVTGFLIVLSNAPGEVLLGRGFWIGWSLSLIAGELWIRHTRHSPMILTSTLLSRRPSNSP
jgi:uncharacterized membrane protein